MKVLLNGATGGTNFGDYLFAEIFNQEVSKNVGKENVFWYESRYCMSDFYKRHLNYETKKYKLREIDALICVSGGYFCGNDKRIRDYIIRYLRYFHLCVRCIRRKIPIAIIGVEVSKPKLKLMEKIERFILKESSLVVVRNEESYNQLLNYGIKNGICTADTAHIISADFCDAFSLPENIARLKKRKLFFHIQASCMEVAYKMLDAVNVFLANHEEYDVVLGLDQYIREKNFLDDFSKKVRCRNVVVYNYDNPIELCKVLSNMDFILTPKLHVGIIGATFSKSVLSFSDHSEKICRFYNQLNESGRSLSMCDFSTEKAVEMMEVYHLRSLNVPQKTIEKSKLNLKIMNEFLDELSARKEQY